MKVLSIGMDKDILKEGTASFVRHQAYAKKVEEYHAVVFSRKGGEGKKVRIAENAWAYPTDSSNTLTLFYDAYRICLKLLKKKGDWVISAQDPFESGVTALIVGKTTRIPFQIQEHGDFFSQPYWRAESFLNRLRYLVGLHIVRQADHVRAVSIRIRDTLLKIGVQKENITVTPVYTDIEGFSNATPDPSLEKEKEDGTTLVLSMARFVPQKNLSLLINSFVKALKKGAKAKLVLVGKGAEEEDLRTLASTAPEGSVIFKDWTDNPASAMHSADIYALSSNYEGWGRVCIEALATGTPLLMTDVGCAGEVVIDGKDGLVVSVDDEWVFTEGLYRLITDKALRETLAKEGKETVLKLATFEQNVALYIKSLEVCLNSKKEEKEDSEGRK